MASLVAGLVMGLVLATGLAPSDTRASVRLDGAKEGGTLVLGVGSLDYIDPTLAAPVSGGSTPVALAWRNLTEATCALLFRYPVAPPPVVRYNLAGGRGRLSLAVVQRQDLHVHDPAGLPVQHERTGERRELRSRDQPESRSGHALTGRPVPA